MVPYLLRMRAAGCGRAVCDTVWALYSVLRFWVAVPWARVIPDKKLGLHTWLCRMDELPGGVWWLMTVCAWPDIKAAGNNQQADLKCSVGTLN